MKEILLLLAILMNGSLCLAGGEGEEMTDMSHPTVKYSILPDQESQTEPSSAVGHRPLLKAYDQLRIGVCTAFVKGVPIVGGFVAGYFFMTNNGEDTNEANKALMQSAPAFIGSAVGMILGSLSHSAIEYASRGR